MYEFTTLLLSHEFTTLLLSLPEHTETSLRARGRIMIDPDEDFPGDVEVRALPSFGWDQRGGGRRR